MFPSFFWVAWAGMGGNALHGSWSIGGLVFVYWVGYEDWFSWEKFHVDALGWVVLFLVVVFLHGHTEVWVFAGG